MSVLSFGEVLLDHIGDKYYLGGAPTNFAINCSSLGLQVDFYSAIGKDSNGETIKRALAGYSLNTKFIQENQHYPSGIVEVEILDGEPTYEICENVAYDFIDAGPFLKDLVDKNYDLLYFGTLSQRNAVSRKSLETILKQGSFKERFYDCNLRQDFYDEERLRASLSYATIFKANEGELEIIVKSLYKQPKNIRVSCQLLSQEFSIHTLIITAGASGAYLYYKGDLSFVEASSVKLIDAVGAGDAFSAAFATNFIAGKDPSECVLAGHVLGGLVAQQKGALPKISDNLRKKIGISGP